VETAPRLPDGTPFPTLYYLTCPRAAAAISRLEAAGAMRAMTARLAQDEGLRRSYEAAHQDYVARRRKAAIEAGLEPLASRGRTPEEASGPSLLADLAEISGGRMGMGIGRGDSARRVLGQKPVTVEQLEQDCLLIRDLAAGPTHDQHAGRHVPGVERGATHAVDAACRDLVQKLGRDGWLAHTAPDPAAPAPLDVRALCLIRATLARHDALGAFAFALQGPGAAPRRLCTRCIWVATHGSPCQGASRSTNGRRSAPLAARASVMCGW